MTITCLHTFNYIRLRKYLNNDNTLLFDTIHTSWGYRGLHRGRRAGVADRGLCWLPARGGCSCGWDCTGVFPQTATPTLAAWTLRLQQRQQCHYKTNSSTYHLLLMGNKINKPIVNLLLAPTQTKKNKNSLTCLAVTLRNII